jgi:hypothetical protein
MEDKVGLGSGWEERDVHLCFEVDFFDCEIERKPHIFS